MKASTLFLLGIGLAGCQTPAQQAHPVSRTVSSKEAKAIEQKVASLLREPESARFMPPRGAQLKNGDVVVCGAVNSRNAFGGMTDWQPYLGSWPSGSGAEGFRVTAVGGSEAQQRAVFKTCQDFGIFPANL